MSKEIIFPAEDINRAGGELQRVRDFQEVISSISKIALQDISVPTLAQENEPDPVDKAKKLFDSYGSIGTFYLERKYFEYMPEGLANLSFAPLVSRGGKRSAHGVVFGDLYNGEKHSIPVAIKPHISEKSQDSCLNEYFNNAMVQFLGFPNLESVGFICVGPNRAYSLTLRDDTLTTLDSMNWSDYYPFNYKESKESYYSDKWEIWRQISQQTAILHNHGNRVHGDLAVRNIAITISGGVFLIDWERARLMQSEPRDAEVRYNNSYTDLSELMDSICLPLDYDARLQYDFKAGIGMFLGKDIEWWKGFQEVFFDEYRGVREELAQMGNHHSQTKHDVTEELEELEKSLRSNMEMLRGIYE